MKISDLLAWAKNQLENSGVSSSKLDALVLISHALYLSKEEVIFKPDLKVAKNLQKKFFTLINRRCKKEPVSQIIGKREFYGYNFLINRNTLDPRPDSESLIELVLKQFPCRNNNLKILELGVGSGCLIISLLKIYQLSSAIAVDISKKALKICQKNAVLNKVETRLELVKSNLFSKIKPIETFDLIISNPPYIKSADIENLQDEVRKFEPHLALDGGIDGLDFYRKIANKAQTFLNPDGRIIFEIGYNQKNQVIKILQKKGFIFENLQTDLSGIERAISFKKSNQNVSN